MMIDTDPFPKATINMINLNWVEKGKAKTTWEVKGERKQAARPTERVRGLRDRPIAAIVKGVVECIKCSVGVS